MNVRSVSRSSSHPCLVQHVQFDLYLLEKFDLVLHIVVLFACFVEDFGQGFVDGFDLFLGDALLLEVEVEGRFRLLSVRVVSQALHAFE